MVHSMYERQVVQWTLHALHLHLHLYQLLPNVEGP